MPKRKKQKPSSEQGVALIAALLAVTILMAIGLSFSFNMRLEEKAAHNYLNGIKAKYLAEAGVKRAIAKLREDFDGANYSDNFDDNWYILELAPGEGGYRVSVEGAAGRICLNDDGVGSYLPVLLEALGAVLPNIPIDPGEGTDIVNYRDTTLSTDFIVPEEIKEIPNLLNDGGEDYGDLEDYLTVYGYEDPAVNRVPVNINTASQKVLQAVIGGITGISDVHRDAAVLAILEYRSGKEYGNAGTGTDLWKETATNIGDGNTNIFDGVDANRGDGSGSPDPLDPVVSGFMTDGLDNDGDGDDDGADPNDDEDYLFALGARGEFVALMDYLENNDYGSGGSATGFGHFDGMGTTSTDIIRNADPSWDVPPYTYKYTTEFCFKDRYFIITSTGRVLANPANWNSEIYAERIINRIIYR